ncbi:odorant receptor 10a [Drosophila subobscura]|uniref:odorant receptor 10a n=1 Tax=Drosophila subobscura TaxID=7241 RepID=UPI00155B3EB8|nr:odorant receptor 10a [Drosophila subobscura]XP_034671365.1 odorant receptor 10a [Drosophila subobscura]
MWHWLRFLRRDQPLRVYFFAVPRLSLEIMGYWPIGENLPTRAIVHFVILFIGVVTELHAGIAFLQKAQITMALETLCPAGTSAVTLLKMLLMLRYRRDLANMWLRLRHMIFDEGLNRRQQRAIMHEHSVMAARINFWPLSTGFFTCTTYNLKPLLIALVLYLRNPEQELLWNTPFNMTMPEVLLRSPFFPLTYAFIAYTGYVTIFMFGGCDGFYFEFCAHISSLFQSLQEEMRATFQPYQAYLKLTPKQCVLLELQLRDIIIRQNAIFALTSFFRKRYATITLAHFVSAGLVIGFSICNLLTVGNGSLGALLYVAYTVAALSQLLVYCYGGTLVAESSVELSRVAATCPWTLCAPRQRRIILLLILRSQRAPTMAVPFFSPSLSTFASILQTSGSIIALAKSFQ